MMLIVYPSQLLIKKRTDYPEFINTNSAMR